MRLEYLSHVLYNEVPVYGGTASLGIEKVKAISRGDSANTHRFSMCNHWGTHVDLPGHFFEAGQTLEDYAPRFWVFKNPCVVKVSLRPSEVLRPGRWAERIKKKADVIFFKSGWGRLRGKKAYTAENPGIDGEVGHYLRRQHPSVRAIGIDWISVSPYRDRPLGRISHRAFLDPEGENRPIVIIEDMDLAADLAKLNEALVAPWRIGGMDSVPCTVMGRFKR